MKKEIVINASKDRSRIAIVEDGQLVELYVEHPDNVRTLGNIYLARVRKIMPAIQAAFVDIGQKQDAFLHYSDLTENLPELLAMTGEKVAGVKGRTLARAPQKRVADDEGEAEVEDTLEIETPDETPDDAPDGTPAPRAGRSRRPGRGRGRLRGGSTEEEEEEEEQTAGEPPPRRTSRFVVDLTQKPSRPAAPPVAAPTPAPAPSPLAAVEDVQSEHPVRPEDLAPEDAAEAPAVPARTRSRRAPKPAAETADVDAADGSPTDAAGESPAPAPKKRASRARRPAEEPVAEVVPADGLAAEPATPEGETSAAPADAEPVAKPKRASRARPKAVVEAEAEEVSDAAAAPSDPDDIFAAVAAEMEAEALGVSNPKVDRKVDHPAADAAGDEPDAEEDPTADVSEAASEDSDDADGDRPRRRRGRRGGRGRRRGDRTDDASMDEEAEPTGDGQDAAPDAETPPAPRRGRERRPAPAADASADTSAEPAGRGRRRGSAEGNAPTAPVERSAGRDRSRRNADTPAAEDSSGRSAAAPPMRRSEGATPTAVFTGRPESLLRRDGPILVKITKEPISLKGSRVSTDISLAGRFLVLVPAADYVAVSKKIASAKERRRLRTLAGSLKPEGFGVIVRTVAEERDAKTLDTDLRLLLDKWRKIEAQLAEKPAGTKALYEDVNMVSSIVRDLFTEDYERILVDDPKLHKNLKAYVLAVAPHMADNVILHRSNVPIFRAAGLEKAVEEVFQSRVNLPGGGYLYIEHTEAMHVVDVNSGRAGRGLSQSENMLRVNLEAAREVARQLRLRDLGGIIVVDFIDMRSESDKRKVYTALKDAFKRDRAVTKLLPMSDFGIVEITRQRLRPSITTPSSREGMIASDAARAAGAGEIAQPSRFGVEDPDAPAYDDAGTDRMDSYAAYAQAPEAAVPVEGVTPDALVERLGAWLKHYREVVPERYRDRAIAIRVHPLFGSYLRRGLLSALMRWKLKLRLPFRIEEDAAFDPLSFDVRDEKSGKSLTRQYAPPAVSDLA